MEHLFLCPYAGQAFHFFLDKKMKQKNQACLPAKAGLTII